MFVQIHMLQSVPPGNLNRDDTGQPKKCLFGGVTRGRISSQCLKRNIRQSLQFKEEFGDSLANRTKFLPKMVADALKTSDAAIPDGELDEIMNALAAKFKQEKPPTDSGEEGSAPAVVSDADDSGQTGQLVFFPPSFAKRVAQLLLDLRKSEKAVYASFIGRKAKKGETKQVDKKKVGDFVKAIADASKSLTVDIGLFGRMTTSDLVVDVEAACQVAHAISTHETLIESDWFTAMDDKSEATGAAYIGSGEQTTFFNSAVYYKYFNVDVAALRKTVSAKDATRAVGALISAAALAAPTGKQNSFAAHSVPELVVVEISRTKRPISYANAFLQPVDGRAGTHLMTESAKALKQYIDSVVPAFAPPDTQRIVLAVGAASIKFNGASRTVASLDQLVREVVASVEKSA